MYTIIISVCCVQTKKDDRSVQKAQDLSMRGYIREIVTEIPKSIGTVTLLPLRKFTEALSFCGQLNDILEALVTDIGIEIYSNRNE